MRAGAKVNGAGADIPKLAKSISVWAKREAYTMEHTGLPHDHGEEQNHTAAMRELLSGVSNFQSIADMFRQLGDPNRIRIFWLLCHCEECVVNIAAMVDMSSPAVSHHLRGLKDSGLLASRRDGREVYYHASDAPQSRLLHQMIEQGMDIACPKWREEAEQVKIIREIHDQLARHMDQRVTIEELARHYLINPTTLKTVFKEVYGNSLAAHMKEHRMEKAASLLRETELSVAEIAAQVGYESQSKFTAAFKEQFGKLPKEYRRT